MADVTIILTKLSANSGLSLGVPAIKPEATIRFVKESSLSATTLTLTTHSGTWPFTATASDVDLCTRNASSYPPTYTGSSMTVASSATGLYRFKIGSNNTIYQIAISETGLSEVVFNYYDSDESLRIYQAVERSSGSQVEIEFQKEDVGELPSNMDAHQYDSPTSQTVADTHALDNTENAQSWTITGLTGTSTYNWKIDVKEDISIDIPIFEDLGGTETDIDLFPPPA